MAKIVFKIFQKFQKGELYRSKNENRKMEKHIFRLSFKADISGLTLKWGKFEGPPGGILRKSSFTINRKRKRTQNI